MTSTVIDAPVQGLARIAAKPIGWLAWLVERVRARRYDPEKILCPACGFKGDSGTSGKSCRVEFTRTTGPEMGAIRHICFRCGCREIFTKLTHDGRQWLPKTTEDMASKIKQAAKREIL